MTRFKQKATFIAGLLGLFFTLFQLVLHLRGSELCFNTGCKVVEGMLSLSPLFINGLGALFFLLILILFFLERRLKDFSFLFDLLIIAAFSCEGILIGIQLFLARTYCSYCLLIASIILVIGLLRGGRIILSGLFIVALELFLISNIKFPISTDITLTQGTYGVKTCSSPNSVAYLIFSQNCPHCKKVLKELNGCVSCEIHFNPISRIKKELLPGMIPVDNYKPEVNILALKILGINSIPVLIQRTENGFTIIKGDKAILNFIRTNCFCPGNQKIAPLIPQEGDFLLEGPESGVCSLMEECK